jgi:uncharacterized protein with NRDE domain
MCTLALYLRQFENYPLVIAANRDEHFSRAAAPPHIWPEDPAIFAGKDLVSGGTWLGVNDQGMSAAIVNRRLAPDNKVTPRSRGLLCLEMLRTVTVTEASVVCRRQEASAYQPFLLLVTNGAGAFVAYNSGGTIEQIELDAGLHVFGNTSFIGADGKKLDRARELFDKTGESLAALLTESNLDSAVGVLRAVLGDHTPVETADAKGALCVHTPDADYGTVSSSIIFLSAIDRKFYFYHAPGPPCRTELQLDAALEIS